MNYTLMAFAVLMLVGGAVFIIGLRKESSRTARRLVSRAWVQALSGACLLAVVIACGIYGATARDAFPQAEESPLSAPQDAALVSPPVLDPGWSFYGYPESGMAIALPDTWVKVNLRAETIEAATAAMEERLPNLVGLFNEGYTMEDIRASGMVLYAVDTETDPEAAYYASIILECDLHDGRMALSSLLLSIEQRLEERGLHPSHERVELPAGPAEKVLCTDTNDVPPIDETRYLFVRDRTTCVIMMQADVELGDEYAPTFLKIAQTFRWLDQLAVTPAPEPEPLSPSCMPGATFSADLSVPDGTEFAAGESFRKEWGILSNGCAPWPAGTRLVFDSGDRMDGPDGVEVPQTQPGETADISVELVAPASPGTYKGYWQMQAPGGTRFGDRIYVMIVVR